MLPKAKPAAWATDSSLSSSSGIICGHRRSRVRADARQGDQQFAAHFGPLVGQSLGESGHGVLGLRPKFTQSQGRPVTCVLALQRLGQHRHGGVAILGQRVQRRHAHRRVSVLQRFAQAVDHDFRVGMNSLKRRDRHPPHVKVWIADRLGQCRRSVRRVGTDLHQGKRRMCTHRFRLVAELLGQVPQWRLWPPDPCVPRRQWPPHVAFWSPDLSDADELCHGLVVGQLPHDVTSASTAPASSVRSTIRTSNAQVDFAWHA